MDQGKEASFSLYRDSPDQAYCDEDIAEMEKALALNPDDVEAMEDLGDALLDIGRYNEAESIYRRALLIDQDNPDLHRGLGYSLLWQGCGEEAVKEYKEALRLGPQDDAMLWNDLGLALEKTEQYEEAIQAYRRSIIIDPDSARPHYNLGTLFLHNDQPDLAEGELREAARLDPSDKHMWSSLALALRDLGKVEDALQLYQKALEIDPDDADTHWELGDTLQELERDAEAVDAFQKAILLGMDGEAALWNSLGISLKRNGRFGEALEAYRRALSIDPDYAKVHLNIGLCMYRLGDLDEEIAQCQSYLRACPDDQDAQDCLSEALAQQQEDI